jgi:hypothetical protein
MTTKDPYVSISWSESLWQYTAEFVKDYKVVDWKRLTSAEEEALSIYLEADEDRVIDIPASEFWERHADGDLDLDLDGNFFWMLEQISSPEEVTK